jgi:hypothetical protein
MNMQKSTLPSSCKSGERGQNSVSPSVFCRTFIPQNVPRKSLPDAKRIWEIIFPIFPTSQVTLPFEYTEGSKKSCTLKRQLCLTQFIKRGNIISWFRMGVLGPDFVSCVLSLTSVWACSSFWLSFYTCEMRIIAHLPYGVVLRMKWANKCKSLTVSDRNTESTQ